MRRPVGPFSLLAMAFTCALFLPNEVPPQTAREGQTVPVNGMEMYFETTGEGEALALLHGFLETWHLFDPLVDALATHYRLIIPDFRGHGGSAYLWVIPNGRHVPVLRNWSRTFTTTAVAFLGGSLERG